VPSPPSSPPFLGASAPWVDDKEVTYDHVLREVADHLRKSLTERIAKLDLTDVSTDDVVIEMRRQVAECAVDGNLMRAGELSEATWDLIQYRRE
jgi:hypothetical protein